MRHCSCRSCCSSARPPGAAQWASLGDMPAPRRVANGLVFRNAQGIVSVTAAAPDIVRVRFSPSREFGRDHSYAIVNRTLGDPRADVRVTSESSQIVTPSLTVSIQHRPFRISVADASGNDLDADDRRARHRSFRRPRSGSGNACVTTSRSMGLARRRAD